MMMKMKNIALEDLQPNAAKLIGQQWMLITAGKMGAETEDFNTMTASWGGIGFLWNRPVAYVFVRPNRHTAPLLDAEDSFTLSFLPEQYRADLMFCGRHSGSAGAKLPQTSMTACETPSGLVAMNDADVVLECRKMYVQEMDQQAYLDWSEVSPRYYAEGNPLHVLYIAEISQCWVRPS